MSVAKKRYELEINIMPVPVDEDTPDVRVGVGGYMLFSPTKRKLRSRLSLLSYYGLQPGPKMSSLMAQADVIPGERIIVDLNTRKLIIFDPLRDPKSDSKVAEQAELLKKALRENFGMNSGIKFAKRYERELEGPDEIKTVMFEAARLVHGRNAVQVGSNEWPSLDSIKKMPGSREVVYGSGITEQQTVNYHKPFAHSVAVGAAG